MQKKLSAGSFGKVYEGFDIHYNSNSIICKINDYVEMNQIEAEVLIELNNAGFKNFPKLIASGVEKDKPYLIQERLGNTLEYHLMRNKNQFTFKTINLIGIKLLTLFEQFHSIGYVYNDLKLDNICVGTFKDNSS